MDQRITNNFSFYEFGPSRDWLPDNKYQEALLRTLATNLQIVRDNSCKMVISSGVRVADDYDRLIREGYHPSPTSDHFCGNAVSIDKSSKDYLKYGNHYYFSVGAADIVPASMSADELFKIVIKLCVSNKCRFGQIILEKDPIKKKEWVHMANDPSIFFGPPILSLIERPKFLSTIDGGKTYTVVTV